MALVKRKITYRLYPTKKQSSEMYSVLHLHQQLYNAALQQRIEAYRSKKLSVGYNQQAKELTQLRKEDEHYRNLNAQSSQVTLKRLDLAYQNFFRRVREKKDKVGFPRFKSLDRYAGWGYASHGDGWRLMMGEKGKHGSLRLSGIGQVKIRGKARNIGSPKTCEIQHKQGCWYASVTIDCVPKRLSGKTALGIDWGLSTFATIATSEHTIETIENPRVLRKELKELKAKQRALSRKKKGSSNRKKAKAAVAKVHARVSTARKEFLHTTTAALVRKAALISVEKLNVKGMSASGENRKKGLNREILSAAPGSFHQMLKYKAEEAGIEWIEVPTRKVKPTQTCHGCGTQEKKTLFMRTHICACGVMCSRDENAAKVILHWALYGNATGRESTRCGAGALAPALKHETPSITAPAV